MTCVEFERVVLRNVARDLGFALDVSDCLIEIVLDRLSSLHEAICASLERDLKAQMPIGIGVSVRVHKSPFALRIV